MATEASRQHSSSAASRSRTWRRPVALAVYLLGALWSLGALQASLASFWARDVVVALAWLIPALGGWWITAGIGIRLGTTPRAFIEWVSARLGFDEPKNRRDSD